jgi:diaminohydroxyphosphoribosylaminopyrimidine deaminase/5-amino-6-(5-phosphoribosylamino)uracil reductase
MLLDAHIARVVIGVMDPTSRGDGGAAVLARAGVQVETEVLRDEVLTVLRPWLTATVRRRPYVTWAYSTTSNHEPQLNEQLALDLRGRTDLVVASGALDEGVPGGHAAEHFALPDGGTLDGDLSPWLSTTYAGGVRTIVFVGQHHADTLRGTTHAIDEVVVAAPRADPPHALEAIRPQLVPAGFRLIDVTTRGESLMMIRFRRP